jgi:RNA polymerase sigma-70 factor (ECF subfamily)
MKKMLILECIHFAMIPTNERSHGFFALYEKMYNFLMVFALKRGYHHEEIKDIINQTFLELAEKKVDFDKIHNPIGYALTSFKRKLIDNNRRITKLNLLKNELNQQQEKELIISDTLEFSENRAEQNQKLFLLYEELPPRCKKVIYLKYYGGLTNEQIAALTGLSVRSVYNNLHEGIKILRSECQKKDFNLTSMMMGAVLYILSLIPCLESGT